MTSETTRIQHYFKKLESESSRLKKEALLEDYGHDRLFIKTLEFLYNPLITTGISEKKLERMILRSQQENLVNNNNLPSIDSLEKLMDYLKENSTGRDSDLAVVADFITKNSLNSDDTTFINKLVSKNIKAGITSKTINKVFIGDNGDPFVYEFSPMLAADFSKRADKITGEFYITQKLDGIRCLAFKSVNEDNEITVDLFARSGKEIIGQHDIKKEIAQNPIIPHGVILDGELLIKDSDTLSVGEMFRETQKIVRAENSDNDANIIFWVFDTLPLKEFKSGISSKKYYERRNNIENWLSQGKSVKFLPSLYQGTDKSMITKKAEEADNAGYEGVMVNSADGLYQNKRTDNLQKVKSFKTADLLCTGIIEGKGRHEGTLGAVIVEYKNNKVQVGSGFDDIERDRYWNDSTTIVGNIIEVKYFEETIDSTTGKPSLRFPVFIGVRDDKTEDDINYE